MQKSVVSFPRWCTGVINLMLQRLGQQMCCSFPELAVEWFLYCSPSEYYVILPSTELFLNTASFWTDYAGLFKESTINYIPILVSLLRVWIQLYSFYNAVTGSETLYMACTCTCTSTKAVETSLFSVFSGKFLEKVWLLNAAPLGQPLEWGCCWFWMWPGRAKAAFLS